MKNVLILIAVIVALGIAYTVMTGRDQRSASEKVSDAVSELPNGVDKAGKELSSDRTPGQKAGDAVRRMGDKIKENTN